MRFDDQNAVKEVLDIGVILAKEKDRTKVLEMIIDKGMKISGCDAGTLYVYEDDMLHFKIMKTLSMGVDKGGNGEKIDLPPVQLKEGNVCAYAAIHKETVNIPNVRESDRFDFSGPIKYDAITGYFTKSMLVIPITNQEDELIGVLQLINALDDDGKVVAFQEEVEPVILSLSSQAAIVLTNLNYLEEMKTMMWSFTEAMAEAIDARTPYNGNHTRNVAKYSGMLADYINKMTAEGKDTEVFDENRRDQLVMGAFLHDIGKMIIPLNVMNKADRLEERLFAIKDRFALMDAKYEIAGLKGNMSPEDVALKREELKESLALVERVNTAGFLDDDTFGQLENVLKLVYNDGTCEDIPYFTEEEKKCLRVRKGTLTSEERETMESHVVMTERILSKVHFNKGFANSPKWASEHHEMLDGSGYPRHLKADELKLESRMLAVADICDALLATDRPYKKPMPKEKAFAIMKSMAKEGKLEERLVNYMEECITLAENGKV
ncbi:MAG: HD domain-containing protein [Lachnospiraceae bacterium]|nr:HD domain-containing protein [Lachnospiraceae bacterium]